MGVKGRILTNTSHTHEAKMEFITKLKTALISRAEELLRADGVRASSLSEMEVELKKALQEVGSNILGAWLEAQEPKYPADEQVCECGQTARYERCREGKSLTLFGWVSYRRNYYLCAHCHHGHYPLDQRLGIKPGEMSAEVVKVAALVGVEDAYGSSRELLLQTTQLDLSPNSIRSACHQVGEQVEDWEARALQDSQDGPSLLRQRREATPPERLYASMDGYLVRFKDGFHEMKAGAFWIVNAKGHAQAIEYYTDTAPAEAFSNLVWARAVARCAHLARELVFIADGAHWIWRIVQRHFPQAIQIVDWYHASAYLNKVAYAAFGEHTPQAHAWLEQSKTDLYAGRLGSVIRACRALLDLAPKAVAEARSYFAANRTRLRYAKFRSLGLQIGSGSMESGCKQIALERLKIAGAQWSPDGARKLAKTRAAFLSHQVNLSFVPLPQVA
jgi:Uncharacterised protein family (UPF0236)